MARSRKGMFNALTLLPWPVGVVAGIVLFAVVTYGLPWWFGRQAGPIGEGLAQASGKLGFFAWFLLLLSWGAALVSWWEARRRRLLLDTRSDLESLAALGWRQFEQLAGEAFRRQGYQVAETGPGADGGIDLILRKEGKCTLVQCKQWRRQRVDVVTVREMFGLLAHHGASAVKIVALGDYTPAAAAFAAGKPIELINGPTFLSMIREVQSDTDLSADQPTGQGVKANVAVSARGRRVMPCDALASPSPSPCPRCGQAMVERRNSRTGQRFLGCSAFPKCRGTA